MRAQQSLRLADRVCCDFFVVVVTQVFHAMHSLLMHPLAIYAVVFDIRKLLDPATREQVGCITLSDRQLNSLVAGWSRVFDVQVHSVVAFSMLEHLPL